MRRALRWLADRAFTLAELAALFAVLAIPGPSWVIAVAAVALALVSYIDGVERGIRLATGRRPEGGAS